MVTGDLPEYRLSVNLRVGLPPAGIVVVVVVVGGVVAGPETAPPPPLPPPPPHDGSAKTINVATVRRRLMRRTLIDLLRAFLSSDLETDHQRGEAFADALR
jgi:hypothetical protein